MEGVQLRSKRGQKDEKIRRSYSCSDLAQLLGMREGGGSDSEGGGEPVTDSTTATTTITTTTPREKLGSEASSLEAVSRRVSSLVKIRRWQSRKKKSDGPPVISAPIQPSTVLPPSPNRLATILPQNINFNNPFGTLRLNRRKPREGLPVVVLEKCVGPPPTSSQTLPTLREHSAYPLTNPFGTLPRRSAAKRMGVANGGDQSSLTANLDLFLPPSISISHSPSPSPSRSRSHSPSPSPSRSPSRSRSPSPSPSTPPSHSLSDALTVIEKRASTNLTTPSYHSLLGKSMEKVCLSCSCLYIQFPK